MSIAKVEDQYGVVWVVEAGDPARTAVNLLTRLGFKWLVLPRRLLLTGVLGESIISSTGSDQPLSTPAPAGAMPAILVTPRQYRLADCIGVIEAEDARRRAKQRRPRPKKA